MPSRPSRHDSRGGTPQAENRSARCGVDSADAGGKALSGDLVAHEGTARSTGLGAASSSVGAHTNADPKRAAGHCLGQWLTTRSESVELRRAGQDRLLVVAAPCFVSTEHVAGDVPEDGRGNRKPDTTGRRASWSTLRSAAADDASRRGTGDGAGDGGIPWVMRGGSWQGAGQLRGAHPAGILQRGTAAARWSDQTRQPAVALPVVRSRCYPPSLDSQGVRIPHHDPSGSKRCLVGHTAVMKGYGAERVG